MQDAGVALQEFGGAFSCTAHAKVEDHRTARPAVLKLIALVVASAGFFALHADRRFVSLDVTAGEEIFPHRLGNRHQEGSGSHDARIERGAREIDSKVAMQIGLLAVERQVRCVFLEHDIDDEGVGELALFNDAWSASSSRGHAAFRAAVACELFAPDDPHEVLGRLDIENFFLLVADDMPLEAAAWTEPLFAFDGDYLRAPLEVSRQVIASRVRTSNNRLLPGNFLSLDFDLFGMDSRFALQQLELCVAKLFALSAILLDAKQPQHFPQNPVLLLKPVVIFSEFRNPFSRLGRKAVDVFGRDSHC